MRPRRVRILGFLGLGLVTVSLRFEGEELVGSWLSVLFERV